MDIVGTLILAWFLTLFGVDDIVIHGVKELFGINISTAGYYIIFILFCVVLNLIFDK